MRCLFGLVLSVCDSVGDRPISRISRTAEAIKTSNVVRLQKARSLNQHYAN